MRQQTGLKHFSHVQQEAARRPLFKPAGNDVLQRCGQYIVVTGFTVPSFAEHVQHLALDIRPRTSLPWLIPVAYGPDTVEVGPLLGGDAGNCYACWYSRRIAAERQGAYLRRLLESGDPVTLHATVSSVLHDAIETFTAFPDASSHPLRSAVWIFRVLNGTADLHRAVSTGECNCTAGSMPCAQASPQWHRAAKPAANAYRLGDIATLGKMAMDRFLDGTAGLVHDLNANLSFPACAVAVAELEVEIHGRRELGCGASADYESARYLAMLEALERYAGHVPRQRPPAVMMPWDSGEDAIVPLTRFGLHEAAAYANAPLKWPGPGEMTAHVQAYSLTRKRNVLLDEQLVYYSAWKQRGNRRRVVEISNGCALGAAPEECVFHGLLEIIERDAFLAAWYRKRIPVRIRLDTVDEGLFRYQKDYCESLGYALSALDLRTETGIPVVMLVLRGNAMERPAFLCSVAAHPVPENAITKAMNELVVSLAKQTDLMRADPQRVAHLRDHPQAVRQMDDHALRYCSPAAARCCDFLLDGTAAEDPEFLRGKQRALSAATLFEDLQHMVEMLRVEELEVLVADQTPPELAAAGLHVFKTLVPGMLPMTFGRHLRRVGGLTRLDTLPRRLGGTWQLTAPGDINPDPHPFP